MPDPREVEFAACLLAIGGPPVPMKINDKGAPISTAGYMFTVSHWYDTHIESPPTTIGETSGFGFWWVKYKDWIQENRRG